MDLKALGESLGLEEDEFIEIVEIFLDSAYEDVNKLKDALQDQSADAAAEAAHSLKGSAANLGFKDIAGIASQLESDARKNTISGIEEALRRLDDLLSQIKALI